MTYRDRQGMMQGINMYVPACQFVASMAMNECNVVSLGKPALGVDTSIIASTPTNAVANTVTYLTTPWVADATYGRPVVVTALGAPGATYTMRVMGEDYLGQPMVEDFTAAAATAINGKKAFYRVIAVKTIVPTAGAVGCKIGTYGSNLGLPFKGSVEAAKENNVLLDPSLAFGKWLAPDLTDPATSTTGDTRGQFIATAAMDGIKEFIVSLRCDPYVNANNNGGLHGIKQFNG